MSGQEGDRLRMSLARQLGEWMALTVLRLATTSAMLAGAATLVPAVALRAMFPDADDFSAITGATLRPGLILFIGGALASHFSRSRASLLPSERTERSTEPTAFDGAALLLLLPLIIVPLWTITRLEPLVGLWTAMSEFLEAHGIPLALPDPAAEASGVFLAPLIAVLAVPALEAAAAAVFIACPILLLFLMAIRSSRFPRAFLVSVLLSGVLVLTSVAGTDSAREASPFVERLVTDTPTLTEAQQSQLLEPVQQYNVIIQTIAESLVWILVGLAVWTPLLFLSESITTTFGAIPPVELLQEPLPRGRRVVDRPQPSTRA